ncbi:MAG: hypothetical protein KC800_31030, partial [Candidatus Eremiobacteraeota bacterium]|nr:hypothetical protein [Candidatus Eremiobacteraeota bacterium]
MKARKTFITNIIAAVILASTLLAPVSAETDTNVTFSDGYVYLEEDAPNAVEAQESTSASVELTDAL